MPQNFTTRQIGELCCVATWRVQRLFEDGTLPEPSRFAGKRVIPRKMLPQIIDALRARGWLPAAELEEAAQMISSARPLPIEIAALDVDIPDEAIELIAELLLEVVDRQDGMAETGNDKNDTRVAFHGEHNG